MLRHLNKYLNLGLVAVSFAIMSPIQAANDNLPAHSQLVDIGAKRLHVRAMGEEKTGPAIILLSGPNYNYHSDSAWFSALQGELARHNKVYAIDRAGNAWSDFDENASYRLFVDDLYQVLLQLGETEVIFVAFSSANITTRLFAEQYGTNDNIDIKGMLWIDPDVLLDHSIALYQDYPVSWYRAYLPQILPYIETGAWLERTMDKINLEKQEIQALLPRSQASCKSKKMDWAYFDRVSQRRLLIEHQQTRAIEIANYHDDLEAVRDLPLINNIPISVIDSDFELKDIAQATEPEDIERLTLWMQQGTLWSEQVANTSQGQYIELTNSDHLVPIEQPRRIRRAIKWLLKHQ
jgi:polyhydroxybutyrate depolymerase